MKSKLFFFCGGFSDGMQVCFFIACLCCEWTERPCQKLSWEHDNLDTEPASWLRFNCANIQ